MKPEPPGVSERSKFRSLLPEFDDGGRWTVENQGYGWKIRRLDSNRLDLPTYRGSILWRTWELYKERYDDDRIREILAEKYRDSPAAALRRA